MPDSEMGIEGWTTYRKLILSALERLDRDIEAINTKLDNFRNDDMQKIWIEITVLKVKAGIAGFLAGMLGAIVTGIIVYFVTRR